VVFPSTEDAECIDKSGKVIPGLYVAGEAAGPAACGTIRFRDAEKPQQHALTSHCLRKKKLLKNPEALRIFSSFFFLVFLRQKWGVATWHAQFVVFIFTENMTLENVPSFLF